MDYIEKTVNYKFVKAMTIECSNGTKYILEKEDNIFIFKRINYKDIYWSVAKNIQN